MAGWLLVMRTPEEPAERRRQPKPLLSLGMLLPLALALAAAAQPSGARHSLRKLPVHASRADLSQRNEAAGGQRAAAGNFCGTAAGCVYPLPMHATQGTPRGVPPTLDPRRFRTSCEPATHPACSALVLPAVRRMRGRIFTSTHGTQTAAGSLVSALVVQLGSTVPTPLQHGVNESYELDVPVASSAMTVTVRAQNEWGALYGIESFAQSVALLKGTDHGFFPTAQRAYVLTLWPPARIVDSPRTAWRGLM
jgi:hypothetical protein